MPDSVTDTLRHVPEESTEDTSLAKADGEQQMRMRRNDMRLRTLLRDIGGIREKGGVGG